MPVGDMSTAEIAAIFQGKYVESFYTDCAYSPKRGRCIGVRRGPYCGFRLELTGGLEIEIFVEPDIVGERVVECPVPSGGRLRVVAIR